MSRISIVIALALAACSKSESTAPPPPAPPHASTAPIQKDPAAARALIAQGAVVIDVRTPDEYADGHVERATNVPVQEFSQRLGDVDKLVGGDRSRPVVVYCAAGGRAAKAKQQLEAAGYTRVVNGGGYDDLTP